MVSGNLSAGIYCDGGASMEISNSSLEAKADAAMVICNEGAVNLTNVALTGMAQAVKIHFRNGMAKSVITNGTLVSTDGEGILFDGGWGEITIENTTITPAKRMPPKRRLSTGEWREIGCKVNGISALFVGNGIRPLSGLPDIL